MVYEYTLFNIDKKYIETVYMTLQEFDVYFEKHKTAKFYNFTVADKVWQK